MPELAADLDRTTRRGSRSSSPTSASGLALQALRPRRSREGRARGAARRDPRARRRSLPDDGYGASFAIAHDAAYPIALVYWWQGVNELHQRSFIGEKIDGLEPVEWTPAGCVYELAIVEFERRAWIEDVIGNPDGPDVERYLGRRFGGLV